MIVALFVRGHAMMPAIAVAAFFLLLNTAPLNAAVINSVDAHIRATALAVNIFIIHILGDVPSPTLMGWVADMRSLQAAFILPVIAMVISSAILFYGMKFAPPVQAAQPPRPRSHTKREMHYFYWIAGVILALAWSSRVVDAAIGMPSVADVSLPEWDRNPVSSSGNPRVSIIVPARNEEETSSRR